jgi:hypothetical protein
VVAVQQPQLGDQRGFDLPAMKHPHDTASETTIASAPRR